MLVNKKDFQALTLVVTAVTRPVQDPLARLSLKNLYDKSRLFIPVEFQSKSKIEDFISG